MSDEDAEPADLLSVRLLEPEHLRWIGIVTVEWEFLEDIVGVYLLLALSSLDQDERHCVISHIMLKERMDILRSIAHKRIDEDELDDELQSIWQRIDKLKKRRNDVIHMKLGWTNYAHTKAKPFKTTARAKLKTEPVASNLSDLKKLVSDIHKVKERLSAALSRL